LLTGDRLRLDSELINAKGGIKYACPEN